MTDVVSLRSGAGLSVSDRVNDIVLKRPAGRVWLASFVLALLLTTLLMAGIGYLLQRE